MDTYKTIKAPAEGMYKEKGSKFIAYAFPVSSEEECKAIVAKLRKEHHSARHHCYAWRIGPGAERWRANDDGEPGNSAGKPILGQLQSRELTNCLVVVVRYFGGTLLGVGGLIQAYRSAAAQALDRAVTEEKDVMLTFEISFQFEKMNAVMKILKSCNCHILQQHADTQCRIRFGVRKASQPALLSAFSKLNLAPQATE